jgi:phosphotransferase system  glucose/maltose/N-acetylglucosamine-specific IIC component
MIFSILGLILIMVMIPFAWNNIWILFLVGLLPLAFGLGLMVIYVLMQEEIKTEKPAKETKEQKKEKTTPKSKKKE